MKTEYTFKNLKTGESIKIKSYSLSMERYGGVIKLSMDDASLQQTTHLINNDEIARKTDVLFDAQLIALPYDLVLFDFSSCLTYIRDNIVCVQFEGSAAYWDNYELVTEKINN